MDVATVELVARHPTMRTSNTRWTVEVITARGGQSFRVKDLHRSSGRVTPLTAGRSRQHRQTGTFKEGAE